MYIDFVKNKANTTITEIAKALNVAPGSVSEMLQKLAEKVC
ncbi:MAG: winged helix-turn-helix transcriptional regulator [Candidatus Thermoplasmatota archaeon]|nr:winged helix-turn-helix transcriptional regulator [Candidatus Thermoplasmatota archaeon]